MDAISRAALPLGIGLAGARLRRTSARFCLGVEHGDYNGCELFGVGVDRFLWLAYRPLSTDRVRIHSTAFPGEGVVEFRLGEIPRLRSPELAGRWARFPLGVAYVLGGSGMRLTTGIEAVIHSDIPGGGMSRSASLCVNLILSLLDANGLTIEDRLRVARLAQAVENDYVGSPCGLLDQVMILFARKGMGTRFLPSSGAIERIPFPTDTPEFRLMMMDTGTVRPGLEHSTYRVRRQECEELVEILNAAGLPVRSLAEVTPAQHTAIRQGAIPVPSPLLRRLSYIHAARLRFPVMVRAWRAGDMRTVGRCFREDGIGLRDDYEISGPEMETMCDIARTVPGVWGERMLGGGDKGAAGAIASPDGVALLRDAVSGEFPGRHPGLAHAWSVSELSIVDGVTLIEGCFAE
ncbi:MAG: hypothetical protein MUE60_12035 [Candidatus Eisenbacteria bacterium]|nr:hypothetical protein [Candidatus Eisenbacteria bacterium]